MLVHHKIVPVSATHIIKVITILWRPLLWVCMTVTLVCFDDHTDYHEVYATSQLVYHFMIADDEWRKKNDFLQK